MQKLNRKLLDPDRLRELIQDGKSAREIMRELKISKYSLQEQLLMLQVEDMKLVSGSEISMTAELANAIRKLDWIVVTGWVTHWKFARYRLKFLDDPEKVYGGEETIHTLVREGLKEDMPEIYAFLDNFYWTPEDMEQLMLWIEARKGVYPEDSARRWMSYHRDRVREWLP